MNENNIIIDEAMLIQPQHIVFPTSWVGHIPFASWLLNKHKPAKFVELGTHTGNSYLAFCQASQEQRLDIQCYAVDTWQGDEHAGHYTDKVFIELSEYHNKNYESFSRLLRMTFNDALAYFNDGEIDLLHIDGLHTYEAVKHDFETWLPKLSTRGIVLFHDTNVRERGFGVWKLWDELRILHPNIHFDHSSGLGVLFVGSDSTINLLDALEIYQANPALIKKIFTYLGQRISTEHEKNALLHTVNEYQTLISERETLISKYESLINDLRKIEAHRDSDIVILKQEIAQRDGIIDNLNQNIRLRDSQLSAIHRSIFWKISSYLRSRT